MTETRFTKRPHLLTPTDSGATRPSDCSDLCLVTIPFPRSPRVPTGRGILAREQRPVFPRRTSPVAREVVGQRHSGGGEPPSGHRKPVGQKSHSEYQDPVGLFGMPQKRPGQVRKVHQNSRLGDTSSRPLAFRGLGRPSGTPHGLALKARPEAGICRRPSEGSAVFSERLAPRHPPKAVRLFVCPSSLKAPTVAGNRPWVRPQGREGLD